MSSAPKAPARIRQYRHLDDLVCEIDTLDPNKHASIKRWISEAQNHLASYEFLSQQRQADAAYLGLMIAAQIISVIIPANKEFPTFASNKHNATYRDYVGIQKSIKAKWERGEDLLKEIKENNKLYGTASKSEARKDNQKHIRHESLQSSKVNGVPNGETPSGNSSSTPQRKPPPPVPPKPSAISGQPLATGGKPNGSAQKSIPSRPTSPEARNAIDDLSLAARFGALRTNGSISRQPPGSNASVPSTQPSVSPASVNSASRGRPTSARELPVSPGLDMNALNGLPRPPSPTYSPARNSISPARSIPRKPMSTPAALNLPDETVLSPSALSAYISRSTEVSLLVLDVRERTEFDEGHIPAKAIICIEPLQLRQDGISGDQLEELISISPTPREYELFSKRHTYDLVVYHDLSTPSDTFLHKSAKEEHFVVLRRLHQALCDFSYDKPLKRPPLLLSGGLKAWTDLFGPSSLVGDSRLSSPPRHSALGLGISTLSRATPVPIKVGESNNKESNRKTDEKTGPFDINIEEERAWLQNLQSEHEPLAISVPKDAENMDLKRQRRSTSIVRVPATELFARNVEQFFQQFPASPVQQSMMTPIPGTPAVSTPLTPMLASKKYNILDHPFYGFTEVRNPDFHPPASPVRPPPAVPRRSYKGESEKPPFRPIEPPLPPKESPMVGYRSSFAGDLVSSGAPNNFGTVGLQNLGNTCYMNSVLQCMNGSIPLARYFLDGSYKMHINRENPHGSKGELVEAFATVVKHLWEGKYKFVSPMSFKETCGRLRDTFGGTEQQDAQEFLEFFLDFLHEDLNPNANRTKLRDPTPEEEATRERLPVLQASYLEWQRYIHRNYSVVVNWFQGQLSSRVTCMTCNTRSTTYSPFMFLSVPLPPGKKNPTLQDCIDEFCKEEILGDGNMWNCPKCKKDRRATKKLTIVRLPHMLIVHLKRFQRRQKMGRGVWTEKILAPVDFPARRVTLDKYVPVLGEDVGGGWIPPPEMTRPFEYDLYGVVNHFGVLQGGHYTSFVRDMWGEGWREFDDSKSKRVLEEAVLSRETQSSAYILFFVRAHIM